MGNADLTPTLSSPSEAAKARALALSASIETAQAISEWESREVDDDREGIQPNDRVLLIIEDDAAFAQVLLDLARRHDFKGIVASRAEAALRLARDRKVDAITLDLRLPDRDGWVVLDRLKHDPKTRHIPVHIISVDEGEHRGRKQGALAFVHKPASQEALEASLGRIKTFVERPMRQLLVVEPNAEQRKKTIALIGNTDVETEAAATGKEALEVLRKRPFDCLVLDPTLPDMTGFELIEKIKKDLALKDLPIVVYSGKDFSKKEESEIRRVAESVVVMSAKSPEQLLDETALFLHRVEGNLPEPKRRAIEKLRSTDDTLASRKVLIVDDDVRNIFALTTVLERHGISVVFAENGKDGIAQLKKAPDIEAVMMDVMMPEMDGYETMRTIRKIAKFKKLPIIALTAKAMKGDREKCIEAGASDYIAKPVDAEQLLSLLRVWLYR
ncbi:MAG: response regulator [Deltaproteobacteria bacterium]|nr:response regulator [Deltaproteobacteria bacterium]